MRMFTFQLASEKATLLILYTQYCTLWRLKNVRFDCLIETLNRKYPNSVHTQVEIISEPDYLVRILSER